MYNTKLHIKYPKSVLDQNLLENKNTNVHLQTQPLSINILWKDKKKKKKDNVIWILTRLERWPYRDSGGQSERWSTRLLTIHEVWDYQWKEDLWYLKLWGQSWWCLPHTGQKTINKERWILCIPFLFGNVEWRLWKFPAEIHEKPLFLNFNLLSSLIELKINRSSSREMN